MRETVHARARVCVLKTTQLCFPYIWRMASCRMEEGKVLFIIFFTLCEGRSGFAAPFLFLKGCFSIFTDSLSFSSRYGDVTGSPRGISTRADSPREFWRVLKILLLVTHSWLGVLRLSYKNRSPWLQPEYFSSLTGKRGTFPGLECCHFRQGYSPAGPAGLSCVFQVWSVERVRGCWQLHLALINPH